MIEITEFFHQPRSIVNDDDLCVMIFIHCEKKIFDHHHHGQQQQQQK